MVMKGIEHLLGNSFIAAGTAMGSRLASATQVDTEGHAGESLDDRIVRFERACHVFRRVFTALDHGSSGHGVEVRGVARGVHLHVTAAFCHQLAHYASL